MSVGDLCNHCGEGRVRPIQLSFDEAVVVCDNVDCESQLEVSPWSTIIKHNIREGHIPLASNRRHLQHWSRSSNSSGFQSPAFSPALSCESVTDQEVETLLCRYLDSKPKTSEKKGQQEGLSNKKVTANGNSLSSFFELLDDLDLESPVQTSNVKECPPMSKSPALNDISFDPVSSDLDSWMKGIETLSSSIQKDPSENLDTGKTECAEIIDSINSRLYIPSRGSAFSQVSTKKDAAESSGSNDRIKGEKSEGTSVSADNKTYDPVKNFVNSLSEAQFLSPATSTVSEDSGYDESGSKINSVYLPSLEKRNDTSFAIPDHGKKTACDKQNRSSQSLSLSESDPVTRVNLPTSASSSKPRTRSSIQESLVMCDQESSNAATNEQSRDPHQDKHEFGVKTSNTSCKSALNSSDALCKSSHLSDPVLSEENQCSFSSEVSSAKTNNDSTSHCRKRTGRKVGRPKGQARKDDELVKGTSRKRRKLTERKKENSCGSESLSRGLASLLQTPSSSFHVRRDQTRPHNLTTLSFKNRLNVKYSFTL